MTFNKYFLDNPLIPWRIRNHVKRWLYEYAKDHINWAFRLALLGRSRARARAITQGTKHHFFGYYDKTPWSHDDNLLLCHEVGFMDRQPNKNDTAEICVVDLESQAPKKIERLASTHAWSWQQGSMLRWHPTDPNKILFNDQFAEHHICRSIDLSTGHEHHYDFPLYDITPDAKFGLSLNFARLNTRRPGYGYAGLHDPWENQMHSREDGIRRLNLKSGEIELLISLNDLRHMNHTDSMRNVPHWVNHIQISPNGKRFLFLHRWGNATASGGFESRLYSMGVDGSQLRCLLGRGPISHYDWFDEHSLVVWAQHPLAGERFYHLSDETLNISVVGEKVLREDGHCNFSPNRIWMVTDTYPDKHDLRKLSIYRMKDERLIDLELLHAPRSIPAELRCDFHPRWNRKGDKLCIDSLHEGSRQVYLLDVSDVI